MNRRHLFWGMTLVGVGKIFYAMSMPLMKICDALTLRRGYLLLAKYDAQ